MKKSKGLKKIHILFCKVIMLAPIYVLAHYGMYDDNLYNIFSALQLVGFS
jgi:hypothetical protein